MAAERVRGEQVRQFILDEIEKHPSDIAKLAADRFGVTRQAIAKHLNKLVREGAITKQGQTRRTSYLLRPQISWRKDYGIDATLTEDGVWRADVKPKLGEPAGNIPENVFDIWHYGFTEMFNNAIDHSGGARITVAIERTRTKTQVTVYDDGVGIFKKIQTALGLLDERHAVLELAKGKFTTDPARHTGEGIFFASRMFDHFSIRSGSIGFSHQFARPEDFIVEMRPAVSGTAIVMELANDTEREAKAVFDQFAPGDDYGFDKTVVPVSLAQYGDDKLVSRSQAKRLLARIDRFKTVILDFHNVESVGQAFADEIFRVFANAHPSIELIEVHANKAVRAMIARARAHE